MEIRELEVPHSSAGSFLVGLVGSIIGAVVGALIWFVIAVATGYEASIVAWALGGLAGLGMALGYRQARMPAALVAAVIAVIGIFGAKAMMVGYHWRDELQASFNWMRVLDLPAEQYGQVHELAAEDANEGMRREGTCPYDDAYRERFYVAAAKYAALPENELAAASARHMEWALVDRFEDEQYVRDSLPYQLLVETRLAIWYKQEPLPPEEWRQVFEQARAQASAMSPEEQRRACLREAHVQELSGVEFRRRAMRQCLASGDDEGGLGLWREVYAEVAKWDDAALADSFPAALSWLEEGQWEDPAWLRLSLAYIRALRAWQAMMSEAPDAESTPGAGWDTCCQEATADVSSIPDGELVGLVREEHDDSSLAARQYRKADQQREMLYWLAMSVHGGFGAFDLLFGALAVATAYRVARSRADKSGSESENSTDDAGTEDIA